MRRLLVLIAALSFGIVGVCQKTTDSQLKLWYNQPAKNWNEALPLGNGRLGAMVFGNPVNEHIQLNENTLYTGSPNRNDNPLAKEALPKVRQLIFDGKFKDALDMVNETMITQTSHGAAYQTVGPPYPAALIDRHPRRDC